MTDAPLHFARPELVWVLWAWLGLFVVLGLLERRGGDALDRLIAPVLRGRLVTRPSRPRRWAQLVLVGLSGSAMALALMQPQTGLRYVATPQVGAEIMIALDVSRSMLADDARPTRLERAKAEIRDLLGYLEDDHVGLIAFAGRASVLSPMTPDKSFLRLALDDAGPHSVPRGGTKLAEPIRRAVAAFGPPGPAQRALILITDGEDHDSFALDAAKQAAEAGIRIIAIGFGDEAGSEIFVRDPRTGARTRVRDAEGRPVISRLDGEGLRELALATEGAFVPAGTGVLDLASIYEAHIGRLTRGRLDERGRTIRDEAYAVPAAVALVCLLASVLVTGRRVSGLLGVALLAFVSAPTDAVARDPAAAVAARAADDGGTPVEGAPQPSGASGTERAAEVPPIEAESPLPNAADPPRPEERAAPRDPLPDPRTRFNRANAALARGALDEAETLLRGARRDAADDPVLRHAASYNLGHAAVARADARLAEDPEAALAALYEAADWFREAARLQPEAEAPRRNLDVTLRRALILEDELARARQGDVEAALEELIERQRDAVRGSAGLLEQVVRAGELDAAERLREPFRDAATAQRLLRAEADALAERVAREREAILAMPEDTRAPTDSLRAVQLDGVLVHLDDAIERMGQTRRQLRQRRAERAYRRGAAALGALKRARDQLRDPVQQIGVLLGELGPLAAATLRLAEDERDGSAAAGGSAAADEGGAAVAADPRPPTPAFLSPRALEEQGRRLAHRVRELAARFERAAIEASAAGAGTALGGGSGPGAGTAPDVDPAEQAALRAALVEAAPGVVAGAEALEAAVEALEERRYERALADEGRSGEHLAEAQERFFDLRQLLDRTLQGAAQAVELSRDDGEASEEGGGAPDAAGAWGERLAPLVRALQAKNRARIERLGSLLERERAQRLAAIEAEAAADPGAGAGATPGEPDPAALEAERFARAEALRGEAAAAVDAALAALGGGPGTSSDGASSTATPDRAAALDQGRLALSRLEALRTLFLSLVEHLRELTRDQVDLADRSRDAAALAAAERPDDEAERGPETRARTAALATEQSGLEARGGAVADALLAQAEQAAGAAPAPDAAGAPPAPGAADPDRLRRAAEQVASAQLAMREAEDRLAAKRGALAPVLASQAVAIEALEEALALLAPPPPPEQEQPDDGEDPSGDQGPEEQPEGAPPPEPGGDGAEGAGDDPAARPPPVDPSQLLQGVRDREAERRRDRARERARRRAQPVEKDW